MQFNNSPVIWDLRNQQATFQQSLTVREIQNWNILSFGAQNSYPQIVKSAIANCATAKRAVRWMTSFLAGDGFLDTSLNKIKVNSKGWTLSKMLNYCAEQAAMYNCLNLDVRLNPYGEILEIYPAPFEMVRLGFGYSGDWGKEKGKNEFIFAGKSLDGYVAIYDNWAGESVRVNLSFNPNEAIWLPIFGREIEFTDFAQFAQSLYYYPLSETQYYTESPAHPVINDMISWQDGSVFTQKEFKNGLSAGYLIEVIGSSESNSQKNELERLISGAQGADNAGNVIIVQGGARDDNGNIQSTLNITPIERNQAPELLIAIMEGINQRIATCYGVPSSLLSLKSGGVFTSENRVQDYEAYNNLLSQEQETLKSGLEPLLFSFFGREIDLSIKQTTFKTTANAGF